MENFRQISTHTKDFSWKKNDPNSPDFEEFFSKLPDFDGKYQEVVKNFKEFCFIFLLSYLVCRQIRLNYFLDDHHFGYTTKSLKETLLDLSAFGPGASFPPRRILKETVYFLLYLCFFAQEQ
jgi:hypothetical protein